MPTIGSPWLVETTIWASSGMAPRIGIPRMSVTSSMDIISPLRTISMRIRLTMRSVLVISLASRRPMIRSASRMAETSGVVTTKALSAPAMAFLKPCSIPAGQSRRIKSNSSLRSSTSFFIWPGDTEDLSLVWAEGSKNRFGYLLSFIRACFIRQLPSTTSTRL